MSDTTADSISLQATGGGVDIDATTQVNIASSQAASTAIVFDASNAAGGITLTAGTAGIVPGGLRTSVRTVAVVGPTVLTAANSGETIFFDTSSIVPVVTLPAPAPGLFFTFILAAQGANNATIGTNAAATIIRGMVTTAEVTAGDAADTQGGAVNTINFINTADNLGDRVDVISDGTLWYGSAKTTLALAVTYI